MSWDSLLANSLKKDKKEEAAGWKTMYVFSLIGPDKDLSVTEVRFTSHCTQTRICALNDTSNCTETDELRPLTCFDLLLWHNCYPSITLGRPRPHCGAKSSTLQREMITGLLAFHPVDYWTWPGPLTVDCRQDPAVSDTPLSFKAALCDQSINQWSTAEVTESALCRPGIHTAVYLTISSILER